MIDQKLTQFFSSFYFNFHILRPNKDLWQSDLEIKPTLIVLWGWITRGKLISLKGRKFNQFSWQILLTQLEKEGKRIGRMFKWKNFQFLLAKYSFRCWIKQTFLKLHKNFNQLKILIRKKLICFKDEYSHKFFFSQKTQTKNIFFSLRFFFLVFF